MATAELVGEQRANSYNGHCRRCEKSVKPNDGVIYRGNRGEKWATFCKDHAPLPLGSSEARAAALERKRQTRTLDPDGSLWTPREFSEVCKAFPGARWNPDRSCWVVSLDPSDLGRVVELCDRHKITCPASLRTQTETEAIVLEDDGPEIDARAYPYQRDGIRYLRSKRRCLLGDQPGLGKTMQVLLSLPLDARAIVVCPASLKLNWAKETRTWRPDLKPIVVHGKQRRPLVPAWGQVLIVNYDVLPPETSYAGLSEVEAGSLSETAAVFDECQKMKNYKAARHKRGKSLASSCGRAWLLTGTPIMNRPPDLKGILEVAGLFKDVFGGWNRFLECFNAHKNRWGGMEYGDPTPIVPELLRKVMLRRLTEDVLPDLPEKRYQTIPVELKDEENKERHDRLVELDAALTDALAMFGVQIKAGKLPPFEEFSALRKKLADAKIPAMLEIVEQYEENGEPLIVFSAHRAPVEECGKRKGWAVIYGDTPKEDRQAIVERFQGGGLQGIALTIQAGGEGLTLTRARTALFVDRDWTPALNSQAEARIRRIGSEKGHVTYLDLICDHVLERRVHDLLTSKSAMHEAAIDSEMSTPFTVNQHIPEVETESDEAFAERMRRAEEGDAEREAEKERKATEHRERTAIEDMERAGRAKEAARARSKLILDREHAKAERGGLVMPPLTRERCQAVREAMGYLASVCDHAETQDGQGFSKSDAGLGHILATAGLEDGSDAMEAAQLVCYRYRRQCGERWPILWETGDLAGIVADVLDSQESRMVYQTDGFLF